MKQKGDPYAKLFSTLSRVILMSCILSQLNILYEPVVDVIGKVELRRFMEELRMTHGFESLRKIE